MTGHGDRLTDDEFGKQAQEILASLPEKECERARYLIDMAHAYGFSPRMWQELGLYL